MSSMVGIVALDYPFPPKPIPLSTEQQLEYKAKIRALLKARDAVLIAHYYTDPEIQALAEETGGFVGDSLEMARFGKQHPAQLHHHRVGRRAADRGFRARRRRDGAAHRAARSGGGLHRLSE